MNFTLPGTDRDPVASTCRSPAEVLTGIPFVVILHACILLENRGQDRGLGGLGVRQLPNLALHGPTL